MKNLEAIRQDFPCLRRQVDGKPLVYFDSAATAQVPQVVIDAISTANATLRANVHRGVHTLSAEATEAMERTREKVRAFLGAESTQEIIFTRGTTEGINLVAASFGELLEAGDEIIVTEMEHHSNIVPWQLLVSRRGVVVKPAPILDDGTLDLEALEALFTPRTRLVAVTHASNVLGTINPVADIAAMAHAHGARILVDGAQAVPHLSVDVRAIDCDFYAFSAHKLYGPTGVGVLYGKRELLEKMPPYQGGGEMIGTVSFAGTTFADLPFKFEAGTPNFIDIIAFAAALDYFRALDLTQIAAHEQALLDEATRGISAIPGARVFGTAANKCPVLSFLIGNDSSYDIGLLLDKMGIAIRTGHHCAEPLMTRFGVRGMARASLSFYNTSAEVERFVAATARAAAMLS